MTPRRFLFFTLLLAAVLFAVPACGSGDDDIAADDPGSSDVADGDGGDGGDDDPADGTRPWIAGSWVLESATTADGPLTLPDGASVDLSITGPDSIEGQGGCNSFGGRIEAPFDGANDGGPLSIDELFMTEIGCEHLDFETAYIGSLGQVDEWELAPPSNLVFRGDGIELVYGIAEPAPELTIDGPTWVFDTIFDGEGMERTATSTRADLPDVSASVADGRMVLTAPGCAPVEVMVGYEPGGTDGSFTVDDAASLPDRIDCADAESNLTAAVDGVAQSTGYQVIDGRLTLIGLPGETVSFRAADG